MEKIINNDIFRRSVKTFIQGFLASFIVFLNENTTFDEKALKSIVIGAFSGGLCALMNYWLLVLKKGE